MKTFMFYLTSEAIQFILLIIQNCSAFYTMISVVIYFIFQIWTLKIKEVAVNNYPKTTGITRIYEHLYYKKVRAKIAKLRLNH